MIVPDTLYRYVDTTLIEYVVSGDELVDRGTWSEVVIYERLNAVLFEGCLYVALQTVSTTPPTAVVDENWSSLVIVSAASGSSSGPGIDTVARSTANSALTTAWAGTNLAEIAYSLAVDGTNLALLALSQGGIGGDAGLVAYGIAQIGTNTGTYALNRAEAAFSVAVAGTNAAQSALVVATSGSTLAQTAYLTALEALSQIGTSSSSGPISDAGDAAYIIAQEGTNTGTEALNRAAAALSSAQSAFDIAVVGTNAAATAYSTATSALNDAQSAFDIAVVGTNAGSAALNRANAAYSLAELGTHVPSLSELTDVNIPAPQAQQVLSFNGSRWVAVNVTAHNDLSGLQGGASDQFYHVTLEQNNALTGTGGTPSASNKYVTADSLNVEQGTRLVSDSHLQSQIDVLHAALGISFLGTFTLYMGQVRGGQSDAQLTVVNGVVTSQINPNYAWQDVMQCSDGSIGSFTGQSGWLSNGMLFMDSGSGIKAEDLMVAYTVGTITSLGGTLSSGTGWTSGPTVSDAYTHVCGSETFDAYPVGLVTSAGTLNSGCGWADAPTINSF